MKLIVRIFVIAVLSLIYFSSNNRALALQTNEIFAVGVDSGSWDINSNLYGAPDDNYATATNSYLSGHIRFSQSLDIPINAIITSLVFKIYAAPSGNSGGSNYWNVYLNGDQCSGRPSLSLGNGIRTITIDTATCTGSNDFAKVVRENRDILNLSTVHVVGYPQTNGTHTMVWDAIGLYATYEMPVPIPNPTPPDIPLAPGTVWEWTTATAPATQKEGLVDIISVSVGEGHSLALKSNGTIWAWGLNQHGQLGIGTTSASIISEPVQVKNSDGFGYLTDVKAIAAGKYYSMALKSDGTVWSWGYNGYGARGVGIGRNDGSSKILLPTNVKTSISGGVFSQIIAIAAGQNHSLALKSDGTAWAWGINDYGQTGTGGSIYSSVVYYPEQIMNSIVSIAAGQMHSLFVKNDGTVWGSGKFSGGQLGAYSDSWHDYVSLPIQIPNINNINKVWAQGYISMGLATNGTVYEWGGSRYFPFADPKKVPDLEQVAQISAGGSRTGSTCAALKSDGFVWTFDQKELIIRPVPGLSNISSVSMGGSTNLAVVKMDEAPPTPTTTTTPTPTPKIPLILIPGVAGSELKMAENYAWDQDDGHGGKFSNFYFVDEKVWINAIQAALPGDDDYFDILKLNEDGKTSLVDLTLTGTLFKGYDETIKFFTDNGYELNKTLFIFPYDWRKDLSLTPSLLDQKINEIKTQTGSEKVDIVAHSMGGLVARNYISDSSKAQNVRKLFTLGTPYLGSVDFLKKLRFGGCITADFLNDIADNYGVCFGINPAETKDIVQNMTGGYELISSQEYFNFYNGQDSSHLYPYKVNGQSLDYDQMKSFLAANGHNASLFNPAEAFHILDNQLGNANGVEVTNIVGSGLSTLGQIREKKEKDFFGNTVYKKDGISVNGDKAVPLFSASLIDYGNNKSLLGDAKVFYVKQNHGNLVASGSALNLVKNILEEDISLPGGVSTTPYSFKGTELAVFSPVNIHVYDSLGNHTGPTANDDFEENIPGSSYDTMDDAKFIFLPNDGNYNIKFEATGQGSFDFKIRKYDQDVISQEILYKDIPLTNFTKAEVQLDTASNSSPILYLDIDGDGASDRDIGLSSNLTGNAIYDDISPQTDFQIYGTLGDNGWLKSDATVTLIPQDEATGSGILKTEYSLDNGITVNIYTKPFTISEEKINKLRFRSVDNAGNEEDPQEIEVKIDKTAPEARILIDQEEQDLIVVGLDVNSTTVVRSENKLTKKKDDAFYAITDLAGNSLKLDVREVDKNKLDRFRIHSLQYNNGSVETLVNNYFNVIYNGKKSKLNVKEQYFELKGEIKIKIQYDVRENKSKIIVRENKKEKIKEIRNGLILLQLLTNKGELEANY